MNTTMRIACDLTLALFVILAPARLVQSQEAASVTPRTDFAYQVHRDIPYHTGTDFDAKKHKLDLYIPTDVKDFPVVFFIHGGAWTSGDRWLYGNVGKVFAKKGIGAAVISYRLSPKVKHPTHIEDVARAFSWVHKNIGGYGGRTDQIFVSGQSAGGHLTALLATDESYLKPHNLSPKNIKAAIPISGVYEIKKGFMPTVFGEEEAIISNAAPLRHVNGDEPPFLILYADKDFPTCDTMSIALDKLLRQNKVESSVVEIKERNHISIVYKMMQSDKDPVTAAMLDFIAKQTTTAHKIVAEAKDEN